MELGDTIKYYKGSSENSVKGFVIEIREKTFFLKHKDRSNMVWKGQYFTKMKSDDNGKFKYKPCYDKYNLSKTILIEKVSELAMP